MPWQPAWRRASEQDRETRVWKSFNAQKVVDRQRHTAQAQTVLSQVGRHTFTPQWPGSQIFSLSPGEELFSPRCPGSQITNIWNRNRRPVEPSSCT